MSTFEVAVFNQAVRDKMNAGERHREFKDEWADTHYIEIKAEDAGAARRKAQAQFPETKGFVIAAITAA